MRYFRYVGSDAPAESETRSWDGKESGKRESGGGRGWGRGRVGKRESGGGRVGEGEGGGEGEWGRGRMGKRESNELLGWEGSVINN